MDAVATPEVGKVRFKGLIVGILLLALTCGFVEWTPAQESAVATASISGNVAADQGAVRAVRVRVRDVDHGINYTVFTRNGKFQVRNLVSAAYEVQVIEEDFESSVQTLTLKTGQAGTADIAVKRKPAATREVALLDYDSLYPPGPGRDILERNCFGCHGPQGWHKRGGKTEAEWARALNRMFDQQAYLAGGKIAGIGAPPALEHPVTAEMKNTLVQYLATNFPAGHSPRDWKLDPLVRNEEGLSQAMYIEYDLPPVTGPEFSDGKPSRSVHDVFPSLRTPGLIWAAGIGTGSILSIDVRNPALSIEQRTKEFAIPHPSHINSRPHSVVEFKGKVYYAGLGDDAAGEFDPATGRFQRFPAPTPLGGGHTLRVDSVGNVWFTTVYGHSRINKVDAVTKKVTEFNPYPGANWYGIVVDSKDRVWAVGYGSFFGVIMYDQKKGTWTTYPTSATNRRVTIDPKGTIWANQYFGNAIASIDPESGKVTEYKLPLKYGNPYEGFSDLQGNIWVENAVYNAIAKFDQATKQFTYYPFPDLGMHTPKIEVDAQGTLWFSRFSGRPARLMALKPHANTGSRTSTAR